MFNATISRPVLLPVLLILLVLPVPTVLAQGGAVLEEIIVTANKRGAQSLQDTAGSIQAITAHTLERTLVEGFEDYIKMVPGLTSVSSGTGQSQIVIRGVNANRVTHTDSQARALAGLYIDEMPISITGFNPDLGIVGIERIEVLRGPQGTLYGASSMSGTIRVITKKPELEKVSGRVKADTSFTEEGDMNHGVKASVNLPMAERIAMRVSGYWSEKGGFIDNVAPGNVEEDYNSQYRIGGKAQAAYYGENLDAALTFMFDKVDAEGRPDEYPQDTGDPRLAAVTDELQTFKLVEDSFINEFLGLNLTLDYDVGDIINITSATSAFDVTISNRLDDTFRVQAVTPLPSPLSDFQNKTRYRTKIEELRISSTYESPLQWIVGFYYEANRRKFEQTQPTPGTNAFFEFLTSIGAFPPNLCGTLVSTCFGAATDSVFDGLESVKTDQVAVFGEATYHFTEALRLTLGFRWFDYDSDFFKFAAGAANGGVSIDDVSIKESDWVPKVELAYDISEDYMVYATFSEGFRLGGVNGFIPAATGISCDAQLGALGTFSGAPFGSDSLTNYEVGAKTSWMDNRLQANIAVYLNEFDDIQSSINLDCGFFQRFNAGKLENTGVDAELTFQATDELGLRFGFAWVDSEVTSAVPGLNMEGDEPPYVPEFSASGSIEYSKPVWNGFGFVRTDVSHVGSSGNEFSSRAGIATLPSYTVVDLTLGYEQQGWELSVFARNLFDDEVVTNIDPDRVQPSQLTRGRPRTVGVSVGKRF